MHQPSPKEAREEESTDVIGELEETEPAKSETPKQKDPKVDSQI